MASALAPPEESERPTPAVEVRVLWGGDLVRVVHLDPPRSFHAGEDACDLAIDAERLGARRLPLVLAGKGGVSVIAPRGASGSIVTPTGQRGSVERAVEEGRGEPFVGAVPGIRIPLAMGATVSLTLPPSPGVGTTYRGASGGEGAFAAAPLVLEVSLVRASRGVGRSVWAQGSGRLLASTVAVAAAAAAWFLLAGVMLAPLTPRGDFDGVWEGDPDILREALAVAEQRWGGRIEETDPYAPPPGATIGLLSYGRHTPFEELCEAGRANPGAGFFGLPCTDDPAASLVGIGESGGDVAEGLDICHSAETLKHWRDREDWSGDFDSGLGARHGKPMVRLGVPHVSGRLPPEVVSRVVRKSLRSFTACYECGLSHSPNEQGRISLRFVVGADGAVSHLGNGGSDMPDWGVIGCFMRAFEGMSFPRPESGTATVAIAINVAPGK